MRFPLDWEYSAMFEKERTDIFALSTISTFSLSCLFLLCHKFPPLFPNHAFPNAHFSRVRAFRQGRPPLYFCVLLCAVQYWGITLNDSGTCSGLKINISKTEGTWLGQYEGTETAKSVPITMYRSRPEWTMSSWLLDTFPFVFLYYLDTIVNEIPTRGRHLVQYFCQRIIFLIVLLCY